MPPHGTKTRRRLRRHCGGWHYNRNKTRNLRAVLTYERNNPNRQTHIVPGNTLSLGARMDALLSKQTPLTSEAIVWRGQRTFPISPRSWFSTSTDATIARTYGGRYLFKIHLMPGIHCLDLYDYYAAHGIQNPIHEAEALEEIVGNLGVSMSNNYADFGEVIVQGGGTFWKDPRRKQVGFRYIGKIPAASARSRENEDWSLSMFETWYGPA